MSLASTKMNLEGMAGIILDANRVLYFEDLKMLVLSDLHLGKSGYFQKMGSAIPSHHHAADLARLSQLIEQYQAKEILINGDLFHAELTKDVPLFSSWLEKLKMQVEDISFRLIRGNHDVKTPAYYKSLGFDEVDDFYLKNDFGFIHDPADKELLLKSPNPPRILVYGHVHAGMQIRGKAKQKVRKAAFVIDQTDSLTEIYLPAFGTLTGIKTMNAQKKRSFYLIAENSLFKC